MASARITGTNENISTFGGGGRDYTALSTWEAATDNDLVASTTSEVLECYADSASYDQALVMSGATTNSSYRRIIRAHSGARHNGIPDTGVIFTNTASSHCLYVLENYASIQDVAVSNISISSSSSYYGFLSLNATNVSFVGCQAYNNGNTGSGRYYGFGDYKNTNYFVNCSSMLNDGYGFDLKNVDGSSYVYNCTSIDNGYNGFAAPASGSYIYCKNCLAAQNDSSLEFDGSFNSGSATNASDDATAPGSGSRINQTFTFVDEANDDYHLSSSDAGAKGYGTDLSSDSNFPFDDDIDFETWTTPWSIGFDWIDATGGGGTIPVIMRNYRNFRI
jgi:hypothetical protein